jgi:hypothetical protein
MAISAKIPYTELKAQAEQVFSARHFEVSLLANVANFDPSEVEDQYNTLIGSEVLSQGGYQRQVVYYTPEDITSFNGGDDGFGPARKAVVFEHDGSTDIIQFNTVLVSTGSGNVEPSETLTATTAPGSAVNNDTPDPSNERTYTGFSTTSTGSGVGCIADLVVTNSGASPADYQIIIRSGGYGYSAADVLTISAQQLTDSGITTESTPITFTVPAVSSGSQKVFAVAQLPSTLSLAGGNSVAFYLNPKIFGFYSV